MPKQNIHPKLNKVTVEMTDGTKFEALTTWGKDGDVQKLDIDPTTHPAWNKDQTQLDLKGGQVQKFKNKYDLDF